MFSRKTVMIVGIIILVTLSVLILSLSSRRPYPAYGPGRFAIALVAPFQKMIVGTTRFFHDIWSHYFFLISVVEENEQLRKELWQAKSLKNRCREALLANERLSRLLSVAQEAPQSMIAAQVVGKDPSPWFQTVLVDKGLSDGIQKGWPVINHQGIVGMVIEVTGHYAKVMLITDPNSSVDAVVQESRARGIIKGGTIGYCLLEYVLRKHNVVVGDRVVSSGMDGVFPKGLPVGKVATIVKRQAGIFQEVTITPYVDFERLEEVLIVPLTEQTDPS
jgi:rod shape-determining protein MreC